MTWAGETGILFVQSSDANVVLAKTLVQGLVAVAGLLTGYGLGDVEGAIQALLVSQFLAGSVFWAAMLVFLQPPILVLVFIQVLSFLLALAGALPGGLLGERVRSLSVLSMDWRLPVLALIFVGPVYTLSLLTNALSPVLLADWNLSLAIMIFCVAAAVLLSALGLYRSRYLRPDYAGLLVMGSLIVAVLSLVYLSYVNSFYTVCVLPVRQGLTPCDQVQELNSELWILRGTFLIPGIILFGFAFPKYWSRTMERAGPPAS